MSFRRIIKYWLMIAVVLIAGMVFVKLITARTEVPEIRMTTVSLNSFDIKVNTIGVLDAERSHMISSSIKGEKGKIIYLIDDGAMVKKDDVLIRFDPSPFEDEVRRLKGELESKKAVVNASEQVLEWEKNQAEGEINDAMFNREDAKKEYERYLSYINDLEELGKKGFSYPTEIAQARKKAEQLQAKLEKTDLQLQQIKKAVVFKIASAMAKLQQANSEFDTTSLSLDNARLELDKTVMQAPFPGIVVHYELYRNNQKRKPRVGDTVWQNQPLLYLPDISSMIIKTKVREIDLHKISKGQKCSVHIDAYPDAGFKGEVTSIGVLATERAEGRGNEKYFQLTVSVDGEDPRLRPGMTARVAILTDNVKDALSVPVQAVFVEKGIQYCYVFNGRIYKKVAVSLGRQNEDIAEILSGLHVGEKVSLVRPDDEIK